MMLLLQLAAAADTIVVRQVPQVRTTFEQVVFVASGISSILVLVLLVAGIVALVAMRKKAEEIKERVDDLVKELQPLAQNASGMYQDVREVTKDVKEMVDDSRETVKTANERIRTSITELADRVDQMSRLIGRVHDSAETMATVASTAVGGIKLGARAMGLGKRKKKSVPPAERPRLRRKD
jgi:methyl-accepting chemotaxis protein